MVVAANAPDADVISWLWGASASLQWHRNITHSLLGAPFMALLSVAVVALAMRGKVRWWPAYLIALAGVASHLLLDLTNVYGVRLVLPFSGHWTHWDITPVIDYTIWAILLLGLVAPAMSRLVGSEIGERNPVKGNAGWAVTSLLLLTVWNYTRSVLHDRAVTMVDSHSYNRLAPRRSAAFPSENPLHWRGMAELSLGYVEIPIDLLANFHPADAVTYYKPPRVPAMQTAMTAYPIQAMLQFVQYPLWVIRPASDGATQVSLIDLRFGTPLHSGFTATALVDSSGHVRESAFGLGEVQPR